MSRKVSVERPEPKDDPGYAKAVYRKIRERDIHEQVIAYFKEMQRRRK